MSSKAQFDSGKYDFLGKAKFILPVWMVIAALGLFIIAYKGLNYGIDFVGGTEFQIQFQNQVAADSVRDVMAKSGYENATVQSIGDKNEYLIRVQNAEERSEKETSVAQNEMIAKVKTSVAAGFQDNVVEIRRVDSVGAQVGKELKRNALLATFYSLILILIYIGMRFDYKYAPAAVICLFHDAVLILAIFAILGKEVNVQTLAAVLTLIGYSLNDTIINFDRIRENEVLHRGQDIYNIVNRSINDMLNRTILTSVTTEIACVALFVFSDGVIKEIGFTLMVGILLGTFSSIYIAAPLMIMTDRLEARRVSRLQSAKA